ncbi:MAG: IS200/IS605 family transposase [Pyrinomonadaceae bacterium]
MPHTYTNLLYHIVFSTKDREPYIRTEYRDRIYKYICGTARGLSGKCIVIGGIEDHVHLLVTLKPTTNVAKFLQELKPNVTKWARQNIHPLFEWQNGYGAFTVSESQVAAVKRYIRDQKIHHKQMDFEVEFVRILEKSGVEYKREYLWK